MSGYVPRNLRGSGKRDSDRGDGASTKPDKSASTEPSGPSTTKAGSKKPKSTRPSSSTQAKKRPSPRPTGASSRRERPKKTRWARFRARLRLPRPGWRNTARRLIPATLAVLLLAGGLWFVAGSPTHAPWGDDPAAAATSAARASSEAMFSYDYRTFDESIENGEAHIVGGYSQEYTELLEGLRDEVSQKKAQVSAEADEAAVVDENAECSNDEGETYEGVEVLIFLDQHTKNANIEGTQVDASRVVMCMVSMDGGWQTADATLV